jgi:hypothetical protein
MAGGVHRREQRHTGMTWEKARVAGHVYAQPLYCRGSRSNDAVAVATEDNVIQAFDANTGTVGDDRAPRCFPRGTTAPLEIPTETQQTLLSHPHA